MMVILIAHPNVENREAFIISDGFQLFKNDGVFGSLAVFHHQCNFHSSSPECVAGFPAVNS